ncbi:hypothetical protein [Haloglomus litoreum]|uniref:hypothetical protein n=1 Tax=Haloglomus litoreum TaxID=3034026 RepID=UPI0023E8DA49|nr:hypothetical protein [Haloglomus sp. DT116]
MFDESERASYRGTGTTASSGTYEGVFETSEEWADELREFWDLGDGYAPEPTTARRPPAFRRILCGTVTFYKMLCN